MLNSLFDDVMKTFRDGHTLTRIIIINIFIFVILSLLFLFTNGGHSDQNPGFYQDIVRFISITSEPWDILLRFWANATHMLSHTDFWHLLWNMLFLYWFGRIVGEMIGDKHIIPLYVLGGLMGAVFFVLGNQIVGYQGDIHYALGASASVMAMVVASGMIAPDYGLNLLLIGRVPLKYVVVTLIFLDVIGTASTSNTGGHYAHIGGVVMGAFYIFQLNRGIDFSRPFQAIIESFFSRGSNVERRFDVIRNESKPVYRKSNKSSSNLSNIQQQRIDAILDKIKEVGYENLTAEEKEYLFQAGKSS